MAKIPKWLINRKKLTEEDMSKMVCRNGSFTCGLLTKLFPLDITRRCNSCRKENLKTSHNKNLIQDCKTCKYTQCLRRNHGWKGCEDWKEQS